MDAKKRTRVETMDLPSMVCSYLDRVHMEKMKNSLNTMEALSYPNSKI